jgi:hypothetical protein
MIFEADTVENDLYKNYFNYFGESIEGNLKKASLNINIIIFPALLITDNKLIGRFSDHKIDIKTRLKFHVLLKFLSFIVPKFNIIYKKGNQKINTNIVARFKGNTILNVINFKNVGLRCLGNIKD